MHQIFSRGRYANVTSTLALVVALGGTSYAAVSLPKDSVGTAQIRTHSVKGGDLAGEAVTTGKVKDGTLRRIDFKVGELNAIIAASAKGDAGPTGPAGPTGAVGPAGPAGPAAIGTTPIAFADFDSLGKHRVNTKESGLTFPANEPKRISPGVYCFALEKLPFAPKTAMVTADNVGDVNDTIVSALVFSTPSASPGCEVRVRTTNVKGTLTDRAFSILILG